MLIALVITITIFLLELIGGFISNSLALLSDSGHMLVDVISLIISFVAIYLANKPHDKIEKAESYAALFNGLLLIIISIMIIYEAILRCFNTSEVQSGIMMLVALIGFIANLVSASVLTRKSDVKNNLNLRGAYLHILGDMLGSIGVIIAGILIHFFDWKIADPIASGVFSLIILKSAFQLIIQSIKSLKKRN